MAQGRMGLLGVFGLLLMAFGGSCALMLGGLNRELGGTSFSDYGTVIIVGGIPFLLGLLLLVFDLRKT